MPSNERYYRPPRRCSRARRRSGVEGSCCRNGDACRSEPFGDRARSPRHAFVTSVNRTNEGKTAQEARDVTQADEDAYEADSGVEEDAVSETEG
jgi:hypothetical protein